MNLQDRFYGSQIRGVGKKFITAVSDENLLEAKEAVETGLFGKAGEVLSEEASLQTIADRIISGDVAGRLEESSKKSTKKEGWSEDEEEEEYEVLNLESEEEVEEDSDEEDSDEEDSKEEVKENFDPRTMMQMFQMMMAMAMMGNQGNQGQQGVGGLKPEHARALGKMGGMNPGSVAGPGMGMGMGGGRR